MTLKMLLSASVLVLANAATAQELTVWDWKSGDPAAATYIEAAKAEFEAAHPGVTVNFVMQPHDQYYTLLGTALSAGSGPDVFLVHGGAQAKSRADALADLTAQSTGLAGLADFTADSGAVVALPITIQGFTVYYNKARYAEAGLDPANPPKTWDELKAACEAITAKGAVPCFAMGNKEGFGSEFFVSALAASMLTPEEQAAFAKGELKWSSPKMKAILQAWVDTQAWGWYGEGANSMPKFMDEYEMFMRGDAANTIGLLSDVAHWKQFDDMLGAENVGAFRHPAPEAVVSGTDGGAMLPLAGGIGYGVNKAGANAALATELVQVLAGPGPIAVFAADAGILPANPAVDTSGLASPTLSAILPWTASAAAPMTHANSSPEELEELHRQSQLLLNGEVTVDEAAARLDDVQAKAHGG